MVANGKSSLPGRYDGVVRPYTDADVAKLQGSLKIEYSLAQVGCFLYSHIL